MKNFLSQRKQRDPVPFSAASVSPKVDHSNPYAALYQTGNLREPSPLLFHPFRRLLGCILFLAGIGLAGALGSYNPQDPSINHATDRVSTNCLGPVGASVADCLIQYFGAGAGLWVILLLGWGWRLLYTGTLRPVILKLLSGLGCVAAGSTLLCMIQQLLFAPTGPHGFPLWLTHGGPGNYGWGGAVGYRFGHIILEVFKSNFGPWGMAGSFILISLLCLLLFSLGLGLGPGEWLWVGGGVKKSAVTLTRAARKASKKVAERRTERKLAMRLRQEERDSGEPPEAALSPYGFQENPAPEFSLLSHEPGEWVEEMPAPVATFTPEEVEVENIPPSPEPVRRSLFGKRRASALVPAIPLLSARSERRETPLERGRWQLPPVSLLATPPREKQKRIDPNYYQEKSALILRTLGHFKIDGHISNVQPGPVVTVYEFEPAPGIRVSKVAALSTDLARALAVQGIRIALRPGTTAIGIEVPNDTRRTVYFSDLLRGPNWNPGKGDMPLAIGKDIGGRPFYADLAELPHLLVAGSTGSGKSVGVNAMLMSFLYRFSPQELRLILIDPKQVEFSVYRHVPHLLTPIVDDVRKSISVLKWACAEMERRYSLLQDHGVRNVKGYRERVAQIRAGRRPATARVSKGIGPNGRHVYGDIELPLEDMPYIVIVMDEVADLMATVGKEVEPLIARLAAKARAAGIHLILATQRPSVDVITGVIKNNFPARIAFSVSSSIDSRTILNEPGAEQLLGKGDMLYSNGGGTLIRLQSSFVSTDEIEDVTRFLSRRSEQVFNMDIAAQIEADEQSATSAGGGDLSPAAEARQSRFDDNYHAAVDFVLRSGRASTSAIQRHLSIGFNNGANIMDRMEAEGIVSPAKNGNKREILISHAEWTSRLNAS